MQFGVVANVAEVAQDAGRNPYRLQGYAEALRQRYGVVFCAVGGTEARHCDRDNVRGGTVEQFHGADGYQQRQSGIQSARYADNRRF